MHVPKRLVVTLTTYEQVVKQLREHGAMTSVQLGQLMNWPAAKVANGLRYARDYGLVLPPPGSKRPARDRVYTAAHVPGWPLSAPDTAAKRARDYSETFPPPNLSNLT